MSWSGRIATLGGSRFSLSDLFATASGFDFTDLDVTKTWGADAAPLLRQDGSGTAVTTSGQSVGGALDKSLGLAAGSELVVDGDFSVDPGPWTKNTWTIGGGVANHAAGTGGTNLLQAGIVVSGRWYRLQIDLVGLASAFALLGAGSNTQTYSTTGTKTQISQANTTDVRVGPSTTNDVTVDNFSAKLVLGNHAAQTTSASRPTWQANSGKPYLVPDATDDGLISTLNPAAAMTLVAAVRVSGASQNIMGSTAAANANRCYIGTDSAGKLAGGWGDDSTSTIVGGSDITGADHIVMMVASAAGVRLLLDGALIYSGAATGSPNTTVPISLMARNVNGTLGAFMGGRLYSHLAVQLAIPQGQELALMRAVRDAAGLTSAIPF